MAERIRYRTNGNKLESIKVLAHPTNGALYRVIIDLDEKQYLVLDATTEIIAASGRNSTRNKLQLDVRNVLKELGVEVSTEQRKEYKRKHAEDIL